MEKDPAKRYATAEAFADDLDRWRTDRPIDARPITRLERTVRWCRRNPAPAVAVATVGVALLVIAAVSVLYADRQHHFAVEQTKATERNAKLAEDLKTSLGEQSKATERNAKLAADLKTSLKESNRRLAAQHMQRALSAYERGEIGPGLLWTVESWRSAVAADDPTWQRARGQTSPPGAASIPLCAPSSRTPGPLRALPSAPMAKRWPRRAMTKRRDYGISRPERQSGRSSSIPAPSTAWPSARMASGWPPGPRRSRDYGTPRPEPRSGRRSNNPALYAA